MSKNIFTKNRRGKNVNISDPTPELQYAMEHIDDLRVKIDDLESALARKTIVIIANTNTGETGTTRNFSIPGVATGHSVLAISCASGVSPARVAGASCTQGSIEVTFDIDPSTDHKISLWIAAPNKIL
jgi:hypothetical protein